MRLRLKQFVVAALALVISGGLVPASALAHAQLEGSVPASGSLLKVLPQSFEFRFSEDVESGFGGIRVYDPNGRLIQSGGAFHPRGNGHSLATKLSSDSSPGAYTATYRVISADGHPVSGGSVFNVGSRNGKSAGSVAVLSKPPETGVFVDGALGLARFLEFFAIAIGLGSVLFLVLVWGRIASSGRLPKEIAEVFSSRLVLMVRLAAIFGVLACVLGITAQGALGSGTGLVDGFSPSTVKATVGTRFGEVWALSVLAWVAVGALIAPAVRGARPARAIALPLGFLAAMPALSGHASTRSPAGLMAAANVAHVCAMAAWLGGVAILLLAVIPASAQARGKRSQVLAMALGRFSTVALVSVTVILLTGIIQSVVALDQPSQLFSSNYGRAVSLKVLLVLFLIGAGAGQRRRVIPGLKSLGDGTSGQAIVKRFLLTEMVLFVGVIAVTAALASYSPLATAKTGPVSRTSQAGPLEVQTTVDPAAVGGNVIHIYVLDGKTGQPFSGARGLTVSEELEPKGIGPLVQIPASAGPGHYIASGVTLPVRGTWRVRVNVRVSAFDEYTVTELIPVR